MGMIIKTCDKHGPLGQEMVKAIQTRVDGEIVSTRYKCRLCARERDLAYWRKNAEQKKVEAREYKKTNREKVGKQQLIYEKKNRDQLTDRYVTSLLAEDGAIRVRDLKKIPELIELKRASVLIKREIRKQNLESK